MFLLLLRQMSQWRHLLLLGWLLLLWSLLQMLLLLMHLTRLIHNNKRSSTSLRGLKMASLA